MKIGILGAGNIAATLAETMRRMPEVECYAVASRTLQKAETFAKEHGFQKAFGSYEEMAADTEVELVYIATPHSHHFEHMKLCLNYNKPVLCEKAFTWHASEAKEIFELAEAKKILVTEAIWTRYMPSRRIINELLEGGIIGKVTTLTANLGYSLGGIERIWRPDLAGGALLDVGVYTINFAQMHMQKEIQSMKASVILGESGVDAQDFVDYIYTDHTIAHLNASAVGASDRHGTFYGTEGYMIVDNINNPLNIDVYNTKNQLVQHLDMPEQISGYEYEIYETMDAIQAGKLECDSMPHAETIRVMELMDAVREQWVVL